MMYRRSIVFALMSTTSLVAGCSKQPAPMESPPPPPSATTAMPSVQAHDADVTRAKLDTGAMSAQYAAHFENEKLVRIDEERVLQAGPALGGEYTYQGARLLHYRGGKIAAPATLDLKFDLQGVLLSGRGADVTDEDIAAIRNRAQLLRSHALAQRATRIHSSGH